MALVKISELTAAATIDGTELLELVQAGASRRATVQAIRGELYGPEDVRYHGAVLDGVTDDTDAIQAWLDVGGILYGWTGTARVTSQLEIDSDTHINGRWMKLLHDSTAEEHCINGVRKDNISIERLEIDGNKSGKSFSGVALVAGIHIDASSNIRIHKCYIHDTYEHGISIGAVDGETWATSNAESQHIFVTKNLILNCGNSANERGYGIWTFGIARAVNYTGNIVFDCVGGGVSIDDTSSGGTSDREIYDAIMANNIISSDSEFDGYIGLRYEGAQRGSVTGNTSVSSHGEAFVFQSIQSDGEVGSCPITGNYFEGGKRAARIVDPTDVVFSHNVLKMPAHANNLEAMEFWCNNGTQSNNFKMKGNTIKSAGAGIQFGENASHTTIFRGLQVEGNTLEYIGGSAATSGMNGIYLDGLDDAKITGNSCSGFYNGIHQASSDGVTKLRIKDNDCFDNENYGILISGANEKFIEDNRTYDNGVAGLRVESTANNFGTHLYDNKFMDGSSSAAGIGSTTRDGNIGVGIGTSATAANIASAAAAINTTAKYAGKKVWDTTNNRMLVASGDGATDAWHVIDGSATVTPS